MKKQIIIKHFYAINNNYYIDVEINKNGTIEIFNMLPLQNLSLI